MPSPMIRQIITHSLITLLAVSLAFSLPAAARYILFQWWPRAEEDAQVLFLSELALAAVLVLLFNLFRLAWEGWCMLRIGQAIALVEVRDRGRRLTLPAMPHLTRQSPATRDAHVLAITGYDTFVAADSHLGRLIGSCYEIRVLLLDPDSAGAAQRARAFDDPAAALRAHRAELAASIDRLKQLDAGSRKVRLKLYGLPPFWKIVIVGEHAWIQYCHDGYEVKTQPEFVFALRHDRPELGFFPPFFMHFLELWNDPGQAEYDLVTDELVFRDAAGNATRRSAYVTDGVPETLPEKGSGHPQMA